MVADVLFGALGGLGAGFAVVLALSRWLGGVWAERILDRERSQQAQNLEELKRELEQSFEGWRWGLAREDAQAESLRSAVRDVILPMMSALHSMCWFMWRARVAPDEIGPKDLREYDKQMHSLLPSLSGYLALVAAHDRSVFGKLEELVRTVYRLDVRVAEFGRELTRREASSEDRGGLADELRRLHEEATDLEEAFPRQIADLLAEAVERRSARVLAGSEER